MTDRTLAPDYARIYDDVISRQENYNRAENSPGYQTCVQAASELALLSGNALDVGCGVGFVVEYLAGPAFRFDAWGVDASGVAVARARQRVASGRGLPPERVQQIQNQRLPFEDGFFAVVTCFDVLEHLDEIDIDRAIGEMWRVLRPGGTWLCTVSCRPAGSQDLHGDNLHRTVRGVDWWLARANPDQATFEAGTSQLRLRRTRR